LVKLVDVKKLDEIMQLLERVYGLGVRGLLSIEERDAIVGVLKNEVTKIFTQAVREAEKEAKEAEKLAKAAEKKAKK